MKWLNFWHLVALQKEKAINNSKKKKWCECNTFIKNDSKKQNSVFGIIGLGKMGGNLSLQAIDKGMTPIGKSKSPKPDLKERGGINLSL